MIDAFGFVSVLLVPRRRREQKHEHVWPTIPSAPLPERSHLCVLCVRADIGAPYR